MHQLNTKLGDLSAQGLVEQLYAAESKGIWFGPDHFKFSRCQVQAPDQDARSEYGRPAFPRDLACPSGQDSYCLPLLPYESCKSPLTAANYKP